MANNVTDLGKVGMTPAGSWSASSTYERLDVVTYEGSSYVSLVDSNINFNPSTSTGKWQLMAQHGEFTEQQLEDFKAEVVAESKEEMDDYTDEKKTELDTYEDTKETELNTYATGLKDDFDTNATAKTTAFNENAASKTTDFNTNAGNKTNTFDTNASTKTTAFNDNATSKTTTFNTNATNKTTDFDTNATNKTNDFNDNASDKTDDFDDNVTAKTTAFDEHVDDKTDEFDEHTEEMQQEIDELSANMPWAETDQAIEIQVTDAAKYSKNKLELYGNTSQESTTGINLIPNNLTNQTINGVTFVVNPDKSITINGTASATTQINLLTDTIAEADEITLPAGTYTLQGCPIGGSSSSYKLDITNDGSAIITDYGNNVYSRTFTDSWVFDRVRIVIQSGTTVDDLTFKPMLVSGNTNVDYEPYTGGQPSPNPDYPQPIHVVTGENIIHINDYTDGEFKIGSYNDLSFQARARLTNSKIPIGTPITIETNFDLSVYKWAVYESIEPLPVTQQIGTNTGGWHTDTNIIKYTTANQYVNLNIARIDNRNFTEEEISHFKCKMYITDTKKTEYPINLGSLELCKIGDYQDYLYKENGNWYKYKAISHNVATGSSTEQWTWSLRNENKAVVQSTKIGQCIDGRNFIAICSNSFRGTQGNDVFSSTNNNVNIIGCAEQSKIRIAISPSDFADIDDFKNFLQENNLDFYFVLATPTSTQITDETLISQLDEIYEHLKLVKGTNNITVTAADLAPLMKLSYMQDLPSKLDNLDSRLSLLE